MTELNAALDCEHRQLTQLAPLPGLTMQGCYLRLQTETHSSAALQPRIGLHGACNAQQGPYDPASADMAMS